MASFFTFQNLRGTLASIPTLADGQLYFTEDTKQLYIGTPSGNLAITSSGGIFPITINAVSHEWLNSYNAATGLFTQSQPSFADLSGSIATGQIPSLTVTVAQIDASGTPSSSTYLRGDGSWNTVASATTFEVNATPLISSSTVNFESGTDITVTNPTVGNVKIDFSGTLAQSLANASHKWLNSYDASTGLFTQTQPAYSDISGTPQLAVTFTPVTHEFLTGYNATTGDFSAAQPAFTDLSGSIATGQIPAATITVAQLNVTGTPSSSTFLRGDGTWATASGGSSVNVNGSPVSSPDFNGTTPAAPGGNQNITFQVSGSDVSAYIPSSLPPNGSAGGDLSGTYPNPTVAKVNGGSIPASKSVVGTNSSGQFVDASSSLLLHYARVDLMASDILNLVETPVQILSAPGAGFMNYPVKIAILAKTTGAFPYQLHLGDTGSLILNWGTHEWGYTSFAQFPCDPIVIEEPTDAISFFLQGGTTSIEPVVGNVANVDNQPLMLSKLGSDANAGPVLTAQVDPGNGGSGYAVDDQFAIGGDNQSCGGQVTSVDGGGAVLTFDIVDIGSGVGGGNYIVSGGYDTVVLSGGGDGALLVDVLTIQQGTAPVSVLVYYLIVPTT